MTPCGCCQVRFSSTMHATTTMDQWPDGRYWLQLAPRASDPDGRHPFWATEGGNHLPQFMQDVRGKWLAAWYYFYNATGNGGPNVCVDSGLLQGKGIAGKHGRGPCFHTWREQLPTSADPNNPYPGASNAARAASSGAPAPGARPLRRFHGIAPPIASQSDPSWSTLTPEPTKYCK